MARANWTAVPKPDHGSVEWLERRRVDPATNACVFGASDAPALMGVSPYTTRGDLFAAKRLPAQASEQTDVFIRGNVLEPALVSHAGTLLGVPVATPSLMYAAGRWVVTLDGVDDEAAPNLVVEAKTTTRYAVREAEDLPAEWAYQGWAQMRVLQLPVWFIVLDRDLRISLVELPQNDEAIAALDEEATRFGAAVDGGEVPSGEYLSDLSAEHIANLWKPKAREVELPAISGGWITMLEEARDAAKRAEEQEREARDALARLLLDADVGTIGGHKVVSWKQQPGRVSLDAKALRADLPEIASRYERVGAPYRVMRTHKPKR